MGKCEAIVCQLKKGHSGLHTEKSKPFKFTITWQGDARVKCEFCGKLIHPRYYNWCVVENCSEDIYVCSECAEKEGKEQINKCRKHRGQK